MSAIELILGQLHTARGYTASLLEGTDPEDWFRMPSGGVSHIAWQVGHIAAAEYYLTLKRIRGDRPEDAQLIPAEYLKLFGKGSTPQAEAEAYPSPAEIRTMFERVHQQALEEVTALPQGVLAERTDPPHPMFSTKLGALLFCPLHEMIHAGQIGLIRRLLGNEPLR